MQISAVKGTVQQVKDKTTQYGVMYDVRVDGKWYGAGKNHPGVVAGDMVEFVAKANGNFSNVQGGINKIEGETVNVSRGTVATPAAAPAYVAPQKYSGGNDDRQSSIILQSSRKDALEFLQVLIAAGALPMSDSTAAKAKVSRQGALEALLDDYTARFYQDIQELGKRFIDVPPAPPASTEPSDEWK